MTLREVVYMILDECKVISDDSYFTEEHVMFLVGNYRAALLKREMNKPGNNLSKSNYQKICVSLEQYSPFEEDICAGSSYLKSVEKIPQVMGDNVMKVYPTDFSQNHMIYVSPDRFPYTGNNRWTQNMIYVTKNPDQYLYLKSSNPQYAYLKKVTVEGIFEDYTEAAKLSCDDCNCAVCEPLDSEFPLDSHLVTELIQFVVKELLGAAYRPKDSKNNAEDDLSDLIAWARRNMKSDLQKSIEG